MANGPDRRAASPGHSSQLSAEHKRELLQGALSGALPANVPCRNQCSFCYEAGMATLFPWVRATGIPRYTDESFAYYRKAYQLRQDFHAEQRAAAGEERLPTPFHMDGDEIRYSRQCDFFSLGLSDEQIEEVVRSSDRPMVVYTTGLDADPELVSYLSQRYRDTFRVHLSVVSFDEEIRRRAMHPDCTAAKIRDLCLRLHKPSYSFLVFHSRQIIADVDEASQLAEQTGGRIWVSKLYSSAASSPQVVRDVRRGEREIASAVLTLAERGWRSSARLTLSPGGEVYAYSWQSQLVQLLSECRGDAEEVVFCSRGAYRTISSCLSHLDTGVVAVDSCFGGNTDLTQGMTVQAVRRQLEALRERGDRISRVVLPDSMFSVSYRYDINGDSIGTLREAEPEVEIIVVEIPHDMIMSVLSLSQCARYYRRHGGEHPAGKRADR